MLARPFSVSSTMRIFSTAAQRRRRPSSMMISTSGACTCSGTPLSLHVRPERPVGTRGQLMCAVGACTLSDRAGPPPLSWRGQPPRTPRRRTRCIAGRRGAAGGLAPRGRAAARTKRRTRSGSEPWAEQAGWRVRGADGRSCSMPCCAWDGAWWRHESQAVMVSERLAERPDGLGTGLMAAPLSPPGATTRPYPRQLSGTPGRRWLSAVRRRASVLVSCCRKAPRRAPLPRRRRKRAGRVPCLRRLARPAGWLRWCHLRAWVRTADRGRGQPRPRRGQHRVIRPH